MMKSILVVLIVVSAMTALSISGCSPSSARGWTALHTAADAGDIASAKKILQSQTKLVNADDGDGHTPLHVAVDQGRREMSAFLLDHGASLKAPDSCGWTPLHTAASKGHTAVAELLIARGADVNALDLRKQTPLVLALKWSHSETAEALRAKGAHE